MADRRGYGGSIPHRSPYAPKRARLMRGGPPVPLGEPRVDVPRFLVAPDSIDDPGQSQPAARLRSRSLGRTSSGSELLGSARPILVGPASRSSPASIPALRPDTEGPEASVRWLKLQSADLDRLLVDPVPRHRHQTVENAGRCGAIRRSPEPEDFVPPALARAQRKNIKTSRGPLLILVTGLVAAIAYFATGSSAPPPDTGREPNLATVELKPSIAPPLPALEKELQPTERQSDDTDPSPRGEISSSTARDSIFAGRIEGRDNHDGEVKRAADVASSAVVPQARSGRGHASRESKQAIQGGRRCAKRCGRSSCAPMGNCASEKKDSKRAQVPAARKELTQTTTKPPETPLDQLKHLFSPK